MINHVTYQMPMHRLEDGQLSDFFDLLGFNEIEPAEDVPEGWKVRWFEHFATGEMIHVVATEDEDWPACALGLSHVCVEVESMEDCRLSAWCVRNRLGSPRIWMEFGPWLRVEVRQAS